jgi:hypothetical protein
MKERSWAAFGGYGIVQTTQTNTPWGVCFMLITWPLNSRACCLGRPHTLRLNTNSGPHIPSHETPSIWQM